MNQSIIAIKKQTTGFVLKGALLLIPMLVCVFIGFIPSLKPDIQYAEYFNYFGFGLALLFVLFFLILIIREIHPGNAVEISNKGFTDYLTSKSGIFVEWTNLASVKTFGRKSSAMLGITLENNELLIASVNKRAAAEISSNISIGLPAIVLPQNSMRVSINELKTMFLRYARESRSIDGFRDETPQPNADTIITTEEFTPDEVNELLEKELDVVKPVLDVGSASINIPKAEPTGYQFTRIEPTPAPKQPVVDDDGVTEVVSLDDLLIKLSGDETVTKTAKHEDFESHRDIITDDIEPDIDTPQTDTIDALQKLLANTKREERPAVMTREFVPNVPHKTVKPTVKPQEIEEPLVIDIDHKSDEKSYFEESYPEVVRIIDDDNDEANIPQKPIDDSFIIASVDDEDDKV